MQIIPAKAIADAVIIIAIAVFEKWALPFCRVACVPVSDASVKPEFVFFGWVISFYATVP